MTSKDLNDSKVLIVFKLTELSCSCSKQVNIYFNYLHKTADGESSDLYLKGVFKKVLYMKSLVF